MVPRGSVLCIGIHALHLFTTPARALVAQMPTSKAFPIALKIGRHSNIIFNYPETDEAGIRAHCASHAISRREQIPSKSIKIIKNNVFSTLEPTKIRLKLDFVTYLIKIPQSKGMGVGNMPLLGWFGVVGRSAF